MDDHLMLIRLSRVIFNDHLMIMKGEGHLSPKGSHPFLAGMVFFAKGQPTEPRFDLMFFFERFFDERAQRIAQSIHFFLFPFKGAQLRFITIIVKLKEIGCLPCHTAEVSIQKIFSAIKTKPLPRRFICFWRRFPIAAGLAAGFAILLKHRFTGLWAKARSKPLVGNRLLALKARKVTGKRGYFHGWKSLVEFVWGEYSDFRKGCHNEISFPFKNTPHF